MCVSDHSSNAIWRVWTREEKRTYTCQSSRMRNEEIQRNDILSCLWTIRKNEINLKLKFSFQLFILRDNFTFGYLHVTSPLTYVITTGKWARNKSVFSQAFDNCFLITLDMKQEEIFIVTHISFNSRIILNDFFKACLSCWLIACVDDESLAANLIRCINSDKCARNIHT